MKSRSNTFSKFLEKLALAFVMLCLAHPFCAHSEPAAYYEGQVEPRSGENFGFAQYCCWLPTVPSATKGVLCVVLHPHGNTGVKFENPKPWIELAERHQCALLSLSFVDDADKTKNWSYAFDGSGRALIAALDEVALASGVKELSSSRIVIAGICEAGQFAYGCSAYAPRRVSAFMTMGGSLHQVPLAWRAADVPGLLIAASDRGCSSFDNMFSLFTEGREHFAPWSFALEQIKDYDQGKSSALVEGFLNTALARFQGSSSPSASSVRSETLSHAGGVTLARAAQPNDCFAATAGKILDGGVADWFLPTAVTLAPCLTDLAPPSSDFSFVSVPLPVLGHAGMERVELGTIHLTSSAQEHAAAVFTVYSDAASAVEDIAVASDLAGLSWQSKRVGKDEWQLRCNLDLSAFPSGVFVVSVPIRFLSRGRVKAGGLTTLVSGRITRDVSPEPSAINFGKTSATHQRAHLRLKSASGVPIQVLSIESSLPDGAKAEIQTVVDGFVEIDCWFESSLSLPGPFSGYYLLRMKSDREQTLRILFYGQNSEDKE